LAADDPAEELFAAVVVEEAAMVGFCAFEMDALIRNLGGGLCREARGRRVLRCGSPVGACARSLGMCGDVAESQIRAYNLRIKSLLLEAQLGCRKEGEKKKG
jgi:hypothetical protein